MLCVSYHCSVAVLDGDGVEMGAYGADCPHGVVDPSRAEATLDDLEAAALAEDEVAGRHADILERDVAVAVGRVVVAVDGHHAVDGDAGRVGRHEDDGLLLVGVLVGGIRLAHDDVDVAPGVACAAGPPFLPQSALTSLSLYRGHPPSR